MQLGVGGTVARVAALLAVLFLPGVVEPAGALPLPSRIEGMRLVEPVKRCPPGYRRSTITGNCVRIQPRWPVLSWF